VSAVFVMTMAVITRDSYDDNQVSAKAGVGRWSAHCHLSTKVALTCTVGLGRRGASGSYDHIVGRGSAALEGRRADR